MKPRLFLPAILSGLLLWTAFFPLNLGPVGFVALVPWLTLVRTPASARRRYFAAYVGGFAFFLPALNWLRVAHPMMYFSWLGLALACPVFWAVGLWLVRRLDRLQFVPLALSVPVAWVALEYTRAHFPTGFSLLTHVGLHQKIGFGWYFLGYTQHEFLSLVQAADLGGVYVVSFVVAAVNGLVAEWAMRSSAVRAWLHWPSDVPAPACRRLAAASAAVAALFALAVGYGAFRLDHPEFSTGPRVAAIQASIQQSDKMGDVPGLVVRYNRLCVQAASGADLVVWPETCFPFGWWTIAPNLDPASVPDDVERVLAQHRGVIQYYATGDAPPGSIPVKQEMRFPPWRTNVLLGLNGYEWDGRRDVPTNTALLVDANGKDVARYDKMHLVPFGEYVPFKETLPWMSTFTPYTWDYSCRPGESWTRFPLAAADGKKYTFGCLICYEDSDPYLARQYVGTPERVNFLVNISNDGWFNGTEEHEQHLAICRFRAVETRRSIVRAVNMGISAVIDPDGRVVALPGDSWSKSKKVDGIVSAAVPIDDRPTAYAGFGDWLPAACWVVIALGFLPWIVWKRRPTAV